ncbi:MULTISPECIES: hypothetical protein [Paenarthrobacter]|uniref:Uncharacterized protein n=1 Tax=Paenarthrobacter ureafaciens TaxID=37931 RepID=A0AAX3EDZ6_PAEUR|nr:MULTISPECIES: hypothetical protein [Paenarthrobacter]NKR13346.1 hypothetical protein [Arthrobacter sp. M5]NKR14804.1 hypothetical protein [Arthrobacter sp. M6]OEH62359.1 hypothetical protein A5N13_01485 [Arthrobacter sp. D4]OEH62930.1 hypothetical protein A5N17_09725 [Arthrobacter sp. D2]MDO5865101.1 hypothetical protein [Paenarthrobacter sp. SD-2]
MMQEQQIDSEGTDATAAAGPGFMRRNALVVGVAALLATAVTVTGLTWGSQRNALDGQQQTITGLQGHLASIEAAKSEQVEQDVMQSLGVSQGRIHDDTQVVDRLVKTAFTWDSGQAYEAVRRNLKERYDLSEDGQFLTQFMPPARFNEDASGKRYYYIDTQGLNSSVNADMDLEVVKVTADQYTYAVQVEVAVTSDAVSQNKVAPDRVKSYRTVLVFLTVDAQGKVSGLSAIPSGGSTRHSR